jgi:hypothetical protein
MDEVHAFGAGTIRHVSESIQALLSERACSRAGWTTFAMGSPVAKHARLFHRLGIGDPTIGSETGARIYIRNGKLFQQTAVLKSSP